MMMVMMVMRGKERYWERMSLIHSTFFAYSRQTPPESVSVWLVCVCVCIWWRPFANLGGRCLWCSVCVCVSVHDWRWWCATVSSMSRWWWWCSFRLCLQCLLLTIIAPLCNSGLPTMAFFCRRCLMNFWSSSIFALLLLLLPSMPLPNECLLQCQISPLIICAEVFLLWSWSTSIAASVVASPPPPPPPTHPHVLIAFIVCPSCWRSPHVNCSSKVPANAINQLLKCMGKQSSISSKRQVSIRRKKHKQTNWNRARG